MLPTFSLERSLPKTNNQGLKRKAKKRGQSIVSVCTNSLVNEGAFTIRNFITRSRNIIRPPNHRFEADKELRSHFVHTTPIYRWEIKGFYNGATETNKTNISCPKIIDEDITERIITVWNFRDPIVFLHSFTKLLFLFRHSSFQFYPEIEFHGCEWWA